MGRNRGPMLVAACAVTAGVMGCAQEGTGKAGSTGSGVGESAEVATTLPVIRDATPEQVAERQWQNRLLIVMAEEEADPRLITQRRMLGPAIGGLRERDVLLIEVVGDDPLRESLQVGKGGFHVLLVGKDGGVKLRESSPVLPERINAIVDAMPMRQAEMRQRR